jgi:hypothetical protein
LVAVRNRAATAAASRNAATIEFETARTLRNIREEAQAAELAEMLAEIELFERAEAEEQARATEEIRLAAVAARNRLQEQTAAKISQRFYALQSELETVHAIQRVAMQERYQAEDEEAAWLASNTSINYKGSALYIRHEMEVERAMQGAQVKLAENQKKSAAEKTMLEAKFIKHADEMEKRYLSNSQASRDGETGRKAWARIESIRSGTAPDFAKIDAGVKRRHEMTVNKIKREFERVKAKQTMEVTEWDLQEQERRRIERQQIVTRMRDADEAWFQAVARLRLAMIDEVAFENELY